MRRLLPLLMLPAMACTGEIIKPASVEICIETSMIPGPNTRVAAYWLSENPEEAVDQPLTDGCLVVPEPRYPERLGDGEHQRLKHVSEAVADVVTHTPLLFTYEDRNGDGRFTPFSAGSEPADELLELVESRYGEHIAWIAHFQRLIAGLRVGSGEYAYLTALQPEPGLPFAYTDGYFFTTAAPNPVASPVDPWCQATQKLLSCGQYTGVQAEGGWSSDEPDRIWVANTLPTSIRTTDAHLDQEYPTVDRFAPEPHWDTRDDTDLSCWLTDTVAIGHQWTQIRYLPGEGDTGIVTYSGFERDVRSSECACAYETVDTLVAVPADHRPPWWPCDHQPDPDADPAQTAQVLRRLGDQLGLDLSE